MTVVLKECATYHFEVRKWKVDGCKENIHALSVDNGNIFFSRNEKMVWFRPALEGSIEYLSRTFPKTIQQLSVKKKALSVNMRPDSMDTVSETFVFANEKCNRLVWKDTTMFETVIDKNGYLLRSNFFGNITYGNHEKMFTYNTRKLTNCTYTSMCVYDRYLWCATEYKTSQDKFVTRVDAFDLFVNLDGQDQISSVPDMTFLVDNKGCVGPLKLCVSIEKDAPKDIVYIIIGYMIGGVNVAQVSLTNEKTYNETRCGHLPNEYTIRSMSFDRPFLFFLDEKCIHSYKIFPRTEIHQYIGKYKLRYGSETTQIISMKKQVFWNGEEELYSAEIIQE